MERRNLHRQTLTVSLGVSLLALFIFAVLAYGVVNQTRLVSWDRAVDEGLRNSTWSTATGKTVFKDVSMAGSTPAMVILAFVMAGVALVIYSWRLALIVLVAGLGGCFWDRGLKEVFHVRRPPLVVHSGHKEVAKSVEANESAAAPEKVNWGFPSGHSLGSMVGYGLLAYLLIRLALGGVGVRTAAIALAGLIVLTIGFSRLYLHAHYLSQVLAGFAFGAFWLGLAITVMELLRRRSTRQEMDGEASSSKTCLTEA